MKKPNYPTATATVIDADTVHIGGSFFKRERTCRNAYDGCEFECSECGTQWHLLDRVDAYEEWTHVLLPPYCPQCGARVERDA